MFRKLGEFEKKKKRLGYIYTQIVLLLKMAAEGMENVYEAHSYFSDSFFFLEANSI